MASKKKKRKSLKKRLYRNAIIVKDQEVIVEDGVAKLTDRSAFAGSVATADRLVRTMVNLGGLTLPEAVRMITCNPASVMRISGRKGSFDAGKDADVTIFDENINVKYTIVKGNVIYKA